MKKVLLTLSLLFTAFLGFSQIDTTSRIDINQNVSRQAVAKQFGEYVKEYRIYHELSYTTLQARFSMIASKELEYDVWYTIEEIKRMEQNEFLPLLEVQKEIVKRIIRSYDY